MDKEDYFSLLERYIDSAPVGSRQTLSQTIKRSRALDYADRQSFGSADEVEQFIKDQLQRGPSALPGPQFEEAERFLNQVRANAESLSEKLKSAIPAAPPVHTPIARIQAPSGANELLPNCASCNAEVDYSKYEGPRQLWICKRHGRVQGHWGYVSTEL